MTNPYQPRRRRDRDGLDLIADLPAVPSQPELPVARLRRLGAADDAVAYYLEVWDSMDEAARADWVRSLSVLTDVELRDEIASTLSDAPQGEVRHEGGGYYSVWVDGTQVTTDNIRGRDEAAQTLAQVLAGRG